MPFLKDDLMDIIDGRPFAIALKNAADSRWSGMLRAMKDEEQVGVVFMRDGHIAWAVSNKQRENFGSFLERIGMVPKDKLNDVVQKYRSLGKSKKLGALLEEAGLISHATLRECLKAHVRSAIASMLDDPLIRLQAKDGEMSIDASMVFLLSEVFPEPGETSLAGTPDSPGANEDSGVVSDAAVSEGDGLLDELVPLPGYLYSFVADTKGKILSFHVSEGVQLDIDRILPAVTAWIQSSSIGTVEMEMGTVQFAFIQSEKGSLFAQMTDADNRFFLAVACDTTAKLGVVKHKVAEQMPIVRQFLENQ